jgi:hypothetical protein
VSSSRDGVQIDQHINIAGLSIERGPHSRAEQVKTTHRKQAAKLFDLAAFRFDQLVHSRHFPASIVPDQTWPVTVVLVRVAPGGSV